MNIYVVIDTWHGEGTVVSGAGVEMQDARTIADRTKGGAPGSGYEWSPWTGPDERGVCERRSVSRDGRFGGVSQEIVRVPLAGYPDFGDAVAGLAAAKVRWSNLAHDVIRDIRSTAVTAEQAPTFDTFRSVMDEAIRMRVRLAESGTLHEMVGPGGRIRVGDGPGWEWFKRAADHMPTVECGEVRGPDQVYGIPIVKDPTLAPNEIRIGKWTYLVGTADGPIAEGTMIRIDTEAMLAINGPLDWDRITNPPT